MDWAGRDEPGLPAPETKMQFPQERVHEVLRALPWKVSRQFRLGRRAHVNVQELRAAKAEIKQLAVEESAPLRHINATDSRVALGAWAKSRSSRADPRLGA